LAGEVDQFRFVGWVATRGDGPYVRVAQLALGVAFPEFPEFPDQRQTVGGPRSSAKQYGSVILGEVRAMSLAGAVVTTGVHINATKVEATGQRFCMTTGCSDQDGDTRAEQSR
jgi:hypothetical protein